jgi:hypothetical protein
MTNHSVFRKFVELEEEEDDDDDDDFSEAVSLLREYGLKV